MSVAGLVAPPPIVPLPPTPPTRQLQRLAQRQAEEDQQQQPFVSRYRTLRGKSVSSAHLRPEIDVFEDDFTAGHVESPLPRRRSKSFAAQRRGGTTPRNPPTFALTPKPLNLPSSVTRKLSTTAGAANKIGAPAFAIQPVTGFRKVDENAAPLPRGRTPAAPSGLGIPASDSLLWGRDQEVARLEAETDRILAEQKKLDLARLQAQLATAKTPPKKPKRLALGKLTFLTRSNKSTKSSNGESVPGTPSTAAPTLFSIDRSHDTTPASSPSPESMHFIEAGGKGIVPQKDAPTSASNGGERRVTVRCMSSTINLPVTNETSPVDIIFASANFTTHQIDPASCIVVECYVAFGLERRLRRYERIRDIMNSWDRDQQNTLLIMPLDGSEDISDLDMSNVPRTEESPQGFSMHIYHSTRPGKWNKRWITLGENGQVFASKKADGKASDKDSAALCHLSDFDIYLPKESEMRRHLKPPKRFCYAVKSQQKTAVFSNNTQNFVHFFSTDDPELAQHFRKTVHLWRSWYLVNKQVDLQRKDRALPASPHSSVTKSPATRRGSTSTHKRQESFEEQPYTIGQFQPLMSMEHFDKPMEEFGKAFEEEAKAVQEKIEAEQLVLAERRRAATLTKPQSQTLQMPASPKQPAEFSAGGLLGDAYEKRKKSNALTTPTMPQQDGPFTGGSSLLQQAAAAKTPTPEKPEPQSWFPSASEHSAKARVDSIKATRSTRRPATADASRQPRPQQPLLKISHEDMRQPRPRLGNAVKPPTGSPLINFATGGPTANAFQDGPSRPSVPRSYTGGRVGGPHPPVSMGTRPRALSSSSQQGSRTRSLVSEERPPIPPLPHRSGRREGMPHNGSPRVAVGSREPLVNHAR